MHKKDIQTDTYQNYKEIKIQNKKIRYTKNQIVKLSNIKEKIQKKEQLLEEKEKELKIINEQIKKLPDRYNLERQIKKLEYKQKDYKSIISNGEQNIKRYNHLKQEIEKYEQENLTATRILNRIVKSKDHEQYQKNKIELENLKENHFFEIYAIKGESKEYKEKYKANEERLIELKQANNKIFNNYQILASQKEEIQKDIYEIEKEKLNQIRKAEDIMNEDYLKNHMKNKE